MWFLLCSGGSLSARSRDVERDDRIGVASRNTSGATESGDAKKWNKKNPAEPPGQGHEITTALGNFSFQKSNLVMSRMVMMVLLSNRTFILGFSSLTADFFLARAISVCFIQIQRGIIDFVLIQPYV